LREIKLLITY